MDGRLVVIVGWYKRAQTTRCNQRTYFATHFFISYLALMSPFRTMGFKSMRPASGLVRSRVLKVVRGGVVP